MREGSDPGALSVTYSTERGEGTGEGTVNSPLQVSLLIPSSVVSAETGIAAVKLTLLDQNGNPAQYGGKVQKPVDMRPSFDIGTWQHNGSVPSVPGTYYARVEIQKSSGGAEPETFELRQPLLTARTEDGPALISGYVFALDGNLWLLSTDTTRQRRLTFFDPFYEYADAPEWSPDGKSIAFVYSGQADPSQMPTSDVWVVQSDGTGARQLVEHVPDQMHRAPSWSADGRYLYFTVETAPTGTVTYDPTGVPFGERYVERLEVSSGAHSRLLESAQSVARGGTTDALIYLQDVRTVDPQGVGSVRQRLVRQMSREASSAAGTVVLIDEEQFPLMGAPHVSPDGRWVVIAAVNTGPSPRSSHDFDPAGVFRWLLFEPAVAEAHGLPQDIYIVPSDGSSKVERLTTLDEDEPYPVWQDDGTVAFMATGGLYKVAVDHAGKASGSPNKIFAGVYGGKLTWHAP